MINVGKQHTRIITRLCVKYPFRRYVNNFPESRGAEQIKIKPHLRLCAPVRRQSAKLEVSRRGGPRPNINPGRRQKVLFIPARYDSDRGSIGERLLLNLVFSAFFPPAADARGGIMEY